MEFKPREGQVDYTNIRWAPVVNCVVKHGDKILLLKRSCRLKFYPGYWNGISGFLDDNRSLEEKVKEELKEEIGIEEGDITSFKFCGVFNQEAPEHKKTWIVHAVLVEVKSDAVKPNWEAEDYRWVKISETRQYKLLPGLEKVLAAVALESQSVRNKLLNFLLDISGIGLGIFLVILGFWALRRGFNGDLIWDAVIFLGICAFLIHLFRYLGLKPIRRFLGI
jgi:ADP-ribose pyrophosphatase YjhB (NUDIX family)